MRSKTVIFFVFCSSLKEMRATTIKSCDWPHCSFRTDIGASIHYPTIKSTTAEQRRRRSPVSTLFLRMMMAMMTMMMRLYWWWWWRWWWSFTSTKPQEDNRAVYQLWSSGLLCPKITQALPCTKICQRIYHSNKVHLFRIDQDSKRIYNLKSAPTFVQDSLAMLEQTIKWRLVWQFRSFAFCSQRSYQSRGHVISFSFFLHQRPLFSQDETSHFYKII